MRHYFASLQKASVQNRHLQPERCLIAPLIMGYAQALSLIIRTNINDQIYTYIDESQQERVFLPNYPEN